MASGLYYIFSDIRYLFLLLRKVNSKFSSGENNSVKPQVFLVCTPETSGVTEGISVSEDNFFKKKKKRLPQYLIWAENSALLWQ